MKYTIILFSLLCLFFCACSDSPMSGAQQPTVPVKPDESEPDATTFTAKLPVLRTAGRYLQDANGKRINLHGFAQTYSPYFNENAWQNYDVNGCLSYNRRMIDGILSAGWKVNFVRMHMDPYWSDDSSKQSVRYEGHERFSESRFRKYLDEVFIPMAEYAAERGLYVVFRPPGVCPKQIAVGDDYQEFLLKVWDIVSSHPKLCNNSDVMFELANEPVHILGTDGTYAGNGDGHFSNLKRFFQRIVDKIRANKAGNIIWVPGLAYQSSYAGYAKYKIEGQNIGYAIHVYPGWYGSDAEEPSAELGGVMGGGYEGFRRGWDAQIMPVASFAPVMVTEMDWAPAKYKASWGKSITGMAGGTGFGANFKYIADGTGNVSWLIFSDCRYMTRFVNTPGSAGSYTFLNDPEACLWQAWHWFGEYAGEQPAGATLETLRVPGISDANDMMLGSSKRMVVNAVYTGGTVREVTGECTFDVSDPAVITVDKEHMLKILKEGNATLTVTYTAATGETKRVELPLLVIPAFPLTGQKFNPSIWETGSFDETTRTLITGKYGFGGWKYAGGLDLSAFDTLTVQLGNANESQVSFRLFDTDNYWSQPASYDFGTSRKVVVDLKNMRNKDGVKVNASHLYIVGFWSLGGKPIVIDKLTLE